MAIGYHYADVEGHGALLKAQAGVDDAQVELGRAVIR